MNTAKYILYDLRVIIHITECCSLLLGGHQKCPVCEKKNNQKSPKGAQGFYLKELKLYQPEVTNCSEKNTNARECKWYAKFDIFFSKWQKHW